MNTKDLAQRDNITAKAIHHGLREEPGKMNKQTGLRERGWLHDEWEVTLTRGADTYPGIKYRTGLGHRTKRPVREDEWNRLDRRLLVSGYRMHDAWIYDKPVPPRAANVLDCLLSDASSASEPFEDWCDSLGYDSDSRKALEIYMECQKVRGELRRLLGAAFQEYLDAERL